MIKDLYKSIPLVIASFLSGSYIYAQSSPPRLDGATIQRLVDTVTSKLLPIAGLLAFIFVVYGGYMWINLNGSFPWLKTITKSIPSLSL